MPGLKTRKLGSVEPPLDFVQRALTTRSETLSYRDPGTPSDQGAKAWLQGKSSPLYPTLQLPNSHAAVLQSNLVIFNTMGYINSYGLFEQYHANLPESLSSSVLTWPGSIQIFLFCLLATVSGRLFVSGDYRHVLILVSPSSYSEYSLISFRQRTIKSFSLKFCARALGMASCSAPQCRSSRHTFCVDARWQSLL
jgi:hypothetical protein